MAPGEETARDFQERMYETVQKGFTTMAIAYGSRLGLFDIMAKFTTPKTSQEIADEVGYKERYVREWLGSMVVAGVVDMERDPDRYFLPKHRHATFIGTAKNIGAMSRATFFIGDVEEDLVACFQKDGPRGMPFSRFNQYHSWREEMTSGNYDEVLLDIILPAVPGLIKNLESGITMCDIGGSTGTMVHILASRFPNSMVYNAEVSKEAVKKGREDAERLGLSNAIHEAHDASDLPSDWSEKFDYVFVNDVIHDMSYSDKGLAEISRILKPECYLSMIDISLRSHPLDNVGDKRAPFIYTVSMGICTPVSLYNEGGLGLGATWGVEKATQMLQEAGFSSVDILPVPGDANNAHFLCQKLIR